MPILLFLHKEIYKIFLNLINQEAISLKIKFKKLIKLMITEALLILNNKFQLSFSKKTNRLKSLLLIILVRECSDPSNLKNALSQLSARLKK